MNAWAFVFVVAWEFVIYSAVASRLDCTDLMGADCDSTAPAKQMALLQELQCPVKLSRLSPFFNKPNATAIVVTDAKLDDAFFLWIFFAINFRRPKEHKVQIEVFVTGIQDVAAGVALTKHVFAADKEYFHKGTAPEISLSVFGSKMPAKDAPRHEADTYEPYNNNAPGFPQAAEEQKHLKFWQDIPAGVGRADLVAVMAQFFSFECVHLQTSSLRKPVLDYIVPKPGGILAFQMGFNTKVPGGLEKELWDYLGGQVKAASAKMVFIGNAFSFDKTKGKPGVIDASGSFSQKLMTQAPALWKHLLEAGGKENLLFGTDQMAKWLTLAPMDGVDYEATKLAPALAEFKAKAGIPDMSRQATSIHLQKEFVRARAAGGSTENPVLTLARELHKMATDACGEKVTEYLRRSVVNFEKFGQTLEATDGQHFASLFQDEVPVLFPVTLKGNEQFFPENCTEDHLMWAAQKVDVAQSLEWMDKFAV